MRVHMAAHDAPAVLRLGWVDAPQGLAHAPILALWAQAQGSVGNLAGQVRTLKNALAQVPWYREPALQLATLALDKVAPPDLISLDEARALLEVPVGMGRSSWSEAFVLGRILRAQGALAAARAALERAGVAAHAAQHAEGARLCAAHLAEVCLTLGDAAAAVVYLGRARGPHPL